MAPSPKYLIHSFYLVLWGRDGAMSHQLAMGAKDLMGQEVILALEECQSQREWWGEPSLASLIG